MRNTETSPAHLTTYDPIKDPVIQANTEKHRQHTIATGKHLPTIGELLQLKQDLEEMLPYWRGIQRSVKASVDALKKRKADAERTLKEFTEIGRPLTGMERSDKADAEELIDRCTWRLKRDTMRLAAAEGQIKAWGEKAKEFEKTGRQRLRELQGEEEHRRNNRKHNRESNW